MKKINQELVDISETLDYIISRYSFDNIDIDNIDYLKEIEKKTKVCLMTSIELIKDNSILTAILSNKSNLNDIKKEYSSNKTQINIVNLAIYFLINNEMYKVKLLSEKHPEINLSPLLNIVIDSK